jgi:hypothetical protein
MPDSAFRESVGFSVNLFRVREVQLINRLLAIFLVQALIDQYWREIPIPENLDTRSPANDPRRSTR